jgi:hypothetical protein
MENSVVLNEKFSFPELKEKAKKIIQSIIEKLKSFKDFIKTKVMDFVKTLKQKFKEKQNLKELLNKAKNKVKSVGESVFVLEVTGQQLEDFLESEITIRNYYILDRLLNYDDFLDYYYDAIKNEVKSKDDIKSSIMSVMNTGFDPEDTDDITVRRFIDKYSYLKNDIEKSNFESAVKQLVEKTEKNIKELENKLNEINRYKEEDIKDNVKSISDLLYLSNKNANELETKEKLQDITLRYDILNYVISIYTKICKNYYTNYNKIEAFLVRIQNESSSK